MALEYFDYLCWLSQVDDIYLTVESTSDKSVAIIEEEQRSKWLVHGKSFDEIFLFDIIEVDFFIERGGAEKNWVIGRIGDRSYFGGVNFTELGCSGTLIKVPDAHSTITCKFGRNFIYIFSIWNYILLGCWGKLRIILASEFNHFDTIQLFGGETEYRFSEVEIEDDDLILGSRGYKFVFWAPIYRLDWR